MQIHPPSAHVWDGEFPVHLHPSGEFAVIDVDPDADRRGTRLFMESVSDCDRLIAAAVWARSLLLTRTSERARGGRWCPAKIPGAVPPGEWQCTLAAGHKGRHEARGAFPLPVWFDGDADAAYDETAGTDAS